MAQRDTATGPQAEPARSRSRAEGGGAEGGGGGEGAAAGERLDLAEALMALRREAGVESIMVEGGVALLSSLMRQRCARPLRLGPPRPSP